MDADALLQKVRALALDLPDVTERLSHGSPGWFIGRSPQFASFQDRHHGVDWMAAWVACPTGARGAVVEANPETYFVPPYFGPRGWIGMRLDGRSDWDAVADVLADGWHTVATPGQRAAADGA